MKSLLVISNSNNPFVNHALEEVLFSGYTAYESILFLWVNGPSVVFGRNQNPWREIDVERAKRENVRLIRRLSGGGTVYHDLGNLNFSFIEHQSVYDVGRHFDWIIEAADDLGVKLNVSARKDLLNDGKKVSGNAFYLKGNRRIHHGTLLVDANLADAKHLLKASDPNHTARYSHIKSVVSVPSPIVNMKSIRPDLTVGKVINSIVDRYYKNNEYGVDVLDANQILEDQKRQIRQSMKKFESDEWTFGETPNMNKQEVEDATRHLQSARG